jgi:hypothetical protein
MEIFLKYQPRSPGEDVYDKREEKEGNCELKRKHRKCKNKMEIKKT